MAHTTARKHNYLAEYYSFCQRGSWCLVVYGGSVSSLFQLSKFTESRIHIVALLRMLDQSAVFQIAQLSELATQAHIRVSWNFGLFKRLHPCKDDLYNPWHAQLLKIAQMICLMSTREGSIVTFGWSPIIDRLATNYNYYQWSLILTQFTTRGGVILYWQSNDMSLLFRSERILHIAEFSIWSFSVVTCFLFFAWAWTDDIYAVSRFRFCLLALLRCS